MKNCLLSLPRRTVKMIVCMLRPGLRRKTFQLIVCFVGLLARHLPGHSWFRLVFRLLVKQISILIEPGVKINRAYYRDYLLSEKLLYDIRKYSDYFTFELQG